MNRWVIALPCLMYLTSFAAGIVYMYQLALPENRVVNSVTEMDFGLTYFTVSFSLNLLLTSMIVARLILHRRNIQNAMGASTGAGQLYGAIIIILVESSALYAISFLLFFVPWAASSEVGNTFWSILSEVQVIAPFLIIRRVASRSALTSDTIVSGDPGSICFRSLGESTGDESLPGGNPMGSADACGGVPRELGTIVGTTTDRLPSSPT